MKALLFFIFLTVAMCQIKIPVKPLIDIPKMIITSQPSTAFPTTSQQLDMTIDSSTVLVTESFQQSSTEFNSDLFTTNYPLYNMSSFDGNIKLVNNPSEKTTIETESQLIATPILSQIKPNLEPIAHDNNETMFPLLRMAPIPFETKPDIESIAGGANFPSVTNFPQQTNIIIDSQYGTPYPIPMFRGVPSPPDFTSNVETISNFNKGNEQIPLPNAYLRTASIPSEIKTGVESVSKLLTSFNSSSTNDIKYQLDTNSSQQTASLVPITPRLSTVEDIIPIISVQRPEPRHLLINKNDTEVVAKSLRKPTTPQKKKSKSITTVKSSQKKKQVNADNREKRMEKNTVSDDKKKKGDKIVEPTKLMKTRTPIINNIQ